MSYWGLGLAVAGGVIGGVASYGNPAAISAGASIGGAIGGGIDNENQKDEIQAKQKEATEIATRNSVAAANSSARAKFNQAQRNNVGGQMYAVSQAQQQSSTNFSGVRDKAEPFHASNKPVQNYGSPLRAA